MRTRRPRHDRIHPVRAALIAACLATVTAFIPGDVSTANLVPVSTRIDPVSPAQGTLFTVTVSSVPESPVLGVTGEFAGEKLHFRRTGDDAFNAIAALPIDATGTLELPLAVMRNDSIEYVKVEVRVRTGDYRMEKLTVAPKFGSPYDSATLARIHGDQLKAAGVSSRSHDTPRLWSDSIVRPRDSRVTSGFGDGREFNGRIQSRHMGLDLAGAPGEPVRAAARGVIALVDSFFLAGNVIYIDHGAGLITAYFHLSRQDVAQGDTVEVGQVIGRVGATGRVTGPHLHWVVRYGSITVSPLSLLALADSTGH